MLLTMGTKSFERNLILINWFELKVLLFLRSFRFKVTFSKRIKWFDSSLWILLIELLLFISLQQIRKWQIRIVLIYPMIYLVIIIPNLYLRCRWSNEFLRANLTAFSRLNLRKIWENIICASLFFNWILQIWLGNHWSLLRFFNLRWWIARF